MTRGQRLLVKRDGEVEFVPIGDLCDRYLGDDGAETATIPDDIKAPAFNRETYEMTWEPVTHAIRHETDARTYEITTEKGRTVEVTGDHSLFSVTKDGETKELAAGEIEAGDSLLTPRRLPGPDERVDSVNVLEHLSPEQLEGRRVYVYGFDRETIAELRSQETIRKKPSEDSNRRRYYYTHNGVEILRDSVEQNYIKDGYLPAETVLKLGWEEKAADCELKTYQVGGKESTMPVTLPVDDALVELLAYYVSEGHVGDRQVGFTFGSHEDGLIEATESAVAGITGSSTTVQRERNSTRVKAFGSPLAMFLEAACGSGATEKRIPGFVFEIDPALQQRFIAALYQGDGSDSHPCNELSHTTVSETLARQLSVLWNMHGVLASTERREDNSGYADDPSTAYRTKVYGEDVNIADVFSEKRTPGEQGYKRIPTGLLDDVRVGETSNRTVPDTIPGLLVGAGVGSDLDHAANYQAVIEDALAGEYVTEPRYVHNLKEMGLLNGDHRPTEQLGRLWETIENLQGLTETDMCLLPVKSVEETEPPEYVYDISVPGATGTDENFVVANEGALSVKNSRGQQGIGISAAVLYSQLTSGKPAKITSRTKGSAEAEYFELVIDTDTNEPEIRTEETTSWDRTHGTRIEIEMEANMRARSQLHDYIKHTAVVNPHARVELKEPQKHFKFERAEEAELPDETEEIRPHPHGVELGTVLKMLDATDSHSVSGFLQNEFTRVGKKTADSVIDAFRDRHYGREMTWTPPGAHEAGVSEAVIEATNGKSPEATEAFGEAVEDELAEGGAIAHHDVVAAVREAANEIGHEYDTTLGETVRENVVAAVWTAVTEGLLPRETDEEAEDGDQEESGRRAPDLYGIVDDATSTRKDDAAVEGIADRLAAKFADSADSRDRTTHDGLREYVDRSADMLEEHGDVTFGETARENVLEAVWERMKTVPDDPPKVSTIADSRDTASELLEAMRETSIMSPPTNCLSPISDTLVEAGLRKEYDADFYAASTRDADVHGGDPFIVEAGIAYGGELPAEGSAEVLRFANRVPLVYQRGACATTDVIKNIGWRNYNLDQPGGSGVPNGPVVIMIHVASTNVPFTSESKDAIANVPEIEDEIELAIREAARELKSYLKKRQSMQKRQKKQDVLAEILPEMAEKVSEVTGQSKPNFDDALARIMNNVLVERGVEENGDTSTVTLLVENNSTTNESLEVTDIVTAEPTDLPDDATVVEMDGEWFVKWSPTVDSGDEATLSYVTGSDATFDVTVEGVEDAKLTVNDQ
nr:DNA topoisomerase VI subunit B [Natranaeroarchaeum sulfidigenes]